MPFGIAWMCGGEHMLQFQGPAPMKLAHRDDPMAPAGGHRSMPRIDDACASRTRSWNANPCTVCTITGTPASLRGQPPDETRLSRYECARSRTARAAGSFRRRKRPARSQSGRILRRMTSRFTTPRRLRCRHPGLPGRSSERRPASRRLAQHGPVRRMMRAIPPKRESPTMCRTLTLFCSRYAA